MEVCVKVYLSSREFGGNGLYSLCTILLIHVREKTDLYNIYTFYSCVEMACSPCKVPYYTQYMGRYMKAIFCCNIVETESALLNVFCSLQRICF